MPLAAGVHFLAPTIPVHVIDTGVAGPTVLVQAGIHGDEIAGVHALEELLEEGVRPERGRLIVIPCMNPPAYRARLRAAPGGLDLNRCFPGDAAAPERERRLARALMDLVEGERPAVMATLHESWKRFHPDIPVSFGQTIVYGVEPRPPIVDALVAHMNASLEGPYEKWAPHYYPVATSSTEVIVDAIGPASIVGLCIETWMGFELARRVAMQKEVVRFLLRG
ncbi:MAG: succinylglutamate desuccinylase/aspartoacylase family protein [Deltaproteobacteria bacterium]|nr:succinylglutamate desuccinylase/aspartoacylase family protein [Deltaproteobacteria bacterium]